MCEFISWVEIAGKVLFITDKEHEELMSKGDNRDKSERWGHGAIREYWNLKDNEGVNKECTDFSSPANFHPVIAEAVRMGLLDYRSPERPDELLTPPAWKEYKEIEATAWKECEEITTPAWKEYKEIKAIAWKEYELLTPPALKEYEEIEATAWKEYEEIKAIAWKEYEEIKVIAFWKLFSNVKNRLKVWR